MRKEETMKPEEKEKWREGGSSGPNNETYLKIFFFKRICPFTVITSFIWEYRNRELVSKEIESAQNKRDE
jgi:hypothetical protein